MDKTFGEGIFPDAPLTWSFPRPDASGWEDAITEASRLIGTRQVAGANSAVAPGANSCFTVLGEPYFIASRFAPVNCRPSAATMLRHFLTIALLLSLIAIAKRTQGL